MTEEQGEKSYCIHEVHYDGAGTILGWTASPIAVCGDTPDGLRWQLDKMSECLSKPILRPVGDTLVEEMPLASINDALHAIERICSAFFTTPGRSFAEIHHTPKYR